MQWIDPDYENGTCESNSFVANSDEKGYYNASAPTTTGYYAVKNIYDLAGNVAEWTMESYGTTFRVTRGGPYYDAGSDYPASTRNTYYDPPSSSYDAFGFRVTLYL